MLFGIDTKDWILLGLSTVISVVLGWFFLRLARPRGKVLAFFADGQHVIDQSRPRTVTERVDITFGGASIPRLAVCKIHLWNHGDLHVVASDVAPMDPLRIALDGDGELLEAVVEKCDRACTATVDIGSSADRRSATIGFAFLNEGHAITLRMLHTARTSRLRVEGQLIGGRIVDIRKEERSRVLRLTAASVSVVALALIAIFRFLPVVPGKGFPWVPILLPLCFAAWALFINLSLRNSPVFRLKLRIDGLTPPEPHV